MQKAGPYENRLIIFDFDGVLVNTELTTFNFYKKVLPKYGINLKDKDFKYKIGRKSIDFFKDVLGDKFEQKLVEKLVEQKRGAFIANVKKYLKPLDGVFDLLAACQKSGLIMAIGSQNEKPLIQKSLDIFGFRKYFSFVTSLQDLTNKKPDPEVFWMITTALKIPPSKSVVIEDAPVGIGAAINGGFKSIGITTSFSRKDLESANLVIDSLKEISPEILKKFKVEE